MKTKIKKVIAMLLTLVIAMSTTVPAYAGYGVNVVHTGKGYEVTNPIKKGGEYMLYKSKDGTPLYCINFEKSADTNHENGYSENFEYNNYWRNLGKFKRNMITLVAIHGYPNNNFGANDIMAHLATQVIIWEIQTGQRTDFSTSASTEFNSCAGGRGRQSGNWYVTPFKDSAFLNCYNSILNACANHNTKPSFDNTSVELQGVGYDYRQTITDANGILHEYSVSKRGQNADKLEAYISGNDLVLYATEGCEMDVTLSFNRDGNPALQENGFVIEGLNQELLWGHAKDPIYAKFSVKLSTGNLQITKYAPDNNYDEHQYANISFEVYGPNGYVDTITTDYWGYAYLNNLPMGEYTVKELTPNHFVPQSTQNITIIAGQTTNVDFVNKLKKFNVTVSKKDKETTTSQGNGSLAGAVYGIYNNDVLVDTYTTDSEGKFTTNYYTCGNSWTIKEITPSEGYLLDNTIHHIGAEAGNFNIEYNPLSLNVTEQVIKGNILLVKHTDNGDTQIETPEVGAEFQVYLKSAGSFDNAKDTQRDTLVTDEDGFSQSKQLPYGVYTVHQTKSWDGRFVVDDFDVFVKENGKTYKYIINNANFESYIKIVKLDKETKKQIPYAGAGFQIYDPDGNLVSMSYTYPTPVTIDTFYTNDKGYLVTPEQLPYGKGYKLVEVQAPYGYVLDSTPIDFDITRTNSVFEDDLTLIKLTKENLAQKGYIEIAKTGEVFVGADNSNGNYIPKYETQNLANATYEIYAAEDIVTLDGTVRARKGDLVDTVTTNKNGIAKSTNLYLGKYIVKEIQAPNGYVLDTKEYIVELTYAGQGVEITSTSLSINNERQKVSVSLNKVLEKDDLFNVGMNGEIKNVKFGLFANQDIYLGDELIVPRDGLITSANCNENGNIVFACDLPLGYHWYVKEMATDEHYVLSDVKYGFETMYQGQDASLIKIDVNDGFKIENELKRGRIEIVKKDKDTNELLAGVEFGLFDKDKNLILTATTDENGVCTFENIPYGEYFYQELKCDDKYVIDDTFYPIAVTENEQSLSFDMFNRIKQGILKLFKADKDTNEALAGVEFTIYDENGEVYQTFVTNENGYYETSLPYGKYVIKETKCLDGYMPNNKEYVVVVDEDGKVIKLDILNSSIPPKSPDTGASSLAGVSALVFSLYSLIRKLKKK